MERTIVPSKNKFENKTYRGDRACSGPKFTLAIHVTRADIKPNNAICNHGLIL